MTRCLFLVVPAFISIIALMPADATADARAFTDCARICPHVVVMPAGHFTIGSPAEERGRYSNEGPQGELAIRSFAIGQTEVTRDQYAAFVRDSHRQTPADCPKPGDGSSWDANPSLPNGSWRDPGFGQTGQHPVACVSWDDATAYVAWLSDRTGHHYRLPSEAEWEYAARGGVQASFFWGPAAGNACQYANGSDPSLVHALPAWIETVNRAAHNGDTRAGIVECDDGHAFTAPVRSYRPNRFGLYDMSGNVWEHVADCFVSGAYQTLADSGAAQTDGDCTQRRVRGGSWDDYALDLRSARRTGALSQTQRRNDTGFRIVREID